MGLIESISISPDDVRIVVRPTFPGCIYLGYLEYEITTRLVRLGVTQSVHVDLSDADEVWDESHMTEAGRRRLRRSRAARPQRGAE